MSSKSNPIDLSREGVAAIIQPADANPAHRPRPLLDDPARVALARRLHAAGWRPDYVTQLSDNVVESSVVHPSGRDITITAVDGWSHNLILGGLTADEVAGAIVGAGLAPADAHRDRLHTDPATLAAALRRMAAALDAISGTTLSPVALQINVQAVAYHGTAAERITTVDALGMALVGHPGVTEEGDDAHRLPWKARNAGDINVAVYAGIEDYVLGGTR